MATSNTSLRVTELDFMSIKDNLKEFLRSQNEFTDYDFEGSGMSVLLDVLAYNTYYNAFYLNMVANETFLDTAQIRQNIVSHAKNLNYVPASAQGALAEITVKVTPSVTEDQVTNVLTLEKFTKLIGTDIDGTNYRFVTLNSNTAFKSAGSFNYSNVQIKQGDVVTRQFPVQPVNSKRRFAIPSANVDTTTVMVSVIESASNSYTEVYNLAEDLTEIRANSKVYFLEEDATSNYTIYFGDDVIGKRPANGNIVQVTYLDTVGSYANNISDFIFIDSIGGLYKDNVRVRSTSSSYGGTNKETDDQVRFRAPYYYTTQNRAVTGQDYETIITKDYNNIDAVSVWGGEENDPPVYGKVYMSLKTKGYYTLTNMEKQQIKDDIVARRNVLTVFPEIVDPDYCFVVLQGRVTYDPVLTDKTADQIKQLVKQAIYDYNQKELNTFKSTFRLSRLQYYIENCEKSITGSDIKFYLQKRVAIENNRVKNYTVNFNAPLEKGVLEQKIYSYPQIVVRDITTFERNVFFEEVPQSYTGVDAVDVVNPGMNYTSIPTVTITGDGTGAIAEAKIVNGKLQKVTMVSKGSNYTRATVSITGGGGREATAVAKVQNNYGNLRTYYYKSNGEKVIVGENVGTVDYNAGKIVLTQLYPTGVLGNPYYDVNTLTFNAVSRSDIVRPLRNRILTIDENNNQSIQIEVVAES